MSADRGGLSDEGTGEGEKGGNRERARLNKIKILFNHRVCSIIGDETTF